MSKGHRRFLDPPTPGMVFTVSKPECQHPVASVARYANDKNELVYCLCRLCRDAWFEKKEQS